MSSKPVYCDALSFVIPGLNKMIDIQLDYKTEKRTFVDYNYCFEEMKLGPNLFQKFVSDNERRFDEYKQLYNVTTQNVKLLRIYLNCKNSSFEDMLKYVHDFQNLMSRDVSE